ncbi:hypothetical protein L1987_12818 [Smallanthus sonchifolius]|uniref:Uncharacterized protein n=1 Tax=Smallanthus sonchifolius TaxID=185202 RepID=A0ACB9JH07_9ASTR|nr:hypothetical protein L1987_12818 [Smallanthus sonchifolius]
MTSVNYCKRVRRERKDRKRKARRDGTKKEGFGQCSINLYKKAKESQAKVSENVSSIHQTEKSQEQEKTVEVVNVEEPMKETKQDESYNKVMTEEEEMKALRDYRLPVDSSLLNNLKSMRFQVNKHKAYEAQLAKGSLSIISKPVLEEQEHQKAQHLIHKKNLKQQQREHFREGSEQQLNALKDRLNQLKPEPKASKDQQIDEVLDGESSVPTPTENRKISEVERSTCFKKQSESPTENTRTVESFELGIDNFTKQVLIEKIINCRYDVHRDIFVIRKNKREMPIVQKWS